MDALPTHLVLTELLPKLSPRDCLALAMTCRCMHSRVPSQVDHYGTKFKVGACLKKMIKFICDGSYGAAKWTFAASGTCLSLCRIGKKQFVSVNGYSNPNAQTADAVCLLFEKLIMPKWDHVMFGTGCWYKSIAKKNEYRALSMEMTHLLAHSV